ncbi:class I SAM-dependent methyltransferase [Pseudomonas sp. 14P_8.1_Bac3]|uniref:class I SAM-dependent methyltransferase n=1 Tax=Pseudomonas sp. 14P_8.1_Bac3 TaxID=2971621 RepID=UPI0021C7D69C|nr:class I SAM-dependent methyltransferase [Pseudomonas sp. 14P_8.1_Bac3]MCU1763618.1 class I SAM-dependent methyltransferase [Pseudomonas sp. 14P_8.1_Bac3]
MTPALRREHHLAQSPSPQKAAPGELDCYIEPFGPGLQHLFVLRVSGHDWIGRKVLQHSDSEGWYVSSLLKPSMLLGPLAEWQWGDQGAVIYFRAVSPRDKETAFHSALAQPDSDVRFPFPALDHNGLECVCPPDYWQCTESLATQLNVDEGHFREHCATLLNTLTQPGALIHDPACSTGEFIAHLAYQLADRQCRGSDRSASMIEHALKRHGSSPARFSVADARQIATTGRQCDVLILRFLNTEVMTREDAQQTFHDMVPCVKPGGTILLFGHTPVLVAVPYLAQVQKLELISSVAARPGHLELFQFYRLRKPA